MANYTFINGVVALPAYGERQKVRFVGTWANGDTWSMACVGSLSGDFTLGKGNIAAMPYVNGVTYKKRVYIGFGNQFGFSANNAPTLWEEQNSGAATIAFNSQYGVTDVVRAFSSMQGRLAVFGEQSIQIWQTDADPANFALQQTIDNTGTTEALSVQSIGDADVLYLDSSGIRSLRSKELTLNAEVSDVGTPVDDSVKADKEANTGTICSIVEPGLRQYWLFVNNKIYVLSRHGVSKITAWSTFNPTIRNAVIYPDALRYDTFFGTAPAYYTQNPPLEIGQTYYWTMGANEVQFTCGSTVLFESSAFVATATTAIQLGTAVGALVTSTLTKTSGSLTVAPSKFVIYNGVVYFLTTHGVLYRYGASTLAASYDATQPIVELPWNAMSNPSMTKQATGIDLACSGKWSVYASMDPQSATLPLIATIGNVTVAPDMDTDSSFDIGHIPYSANGTHVKFKFIGDPAQGIPYKYKLGSFTFNYNDSNNK